MHLPAPYLRQCSRSGRLTAIAGMLSAVFCIPPVLHAQTAAPISQTIQAEDFSARQGGTYIVAACNEPAVCVRNLKTGDWLRFDNVNFLEGQYDTIALCYWGWAQSMPHGTVRFRLDSPTATPVATVFTYSTAGYGYDKSASAKAALPRTTGVHTLYVTIEDIAGNGESNLAIDKVLLIGTITVASAEAKIYYVAPNGSDANDGLSLATPFRTIQKAATIMRPGSICRIRQGIYRETVRPVFTGTAGAPLTFEAYNGENAVISGGDPITGWSVHSGSIYKAVMRWDLGEFDNQILVDGKMAWMARCPNVNDAYTPDDGICWGNIKDWTSYRQLAEEPSIFGTRVCMDQPNVWGCNPAWGDNQCTPPALTPFEYTISYGSGAKLVPACLRSSATDAFKGGTITIHNGLVSTGLITASSTPSANLLRIGAVKGTSMQRNYTGRGWISHLFWLLDSPNEWFRNDSTLYLWAPNGGDPSHHLVEAKKRLLGFDLRGKTYVDLTGIRIIAASLSLEDAANCIIDKCHFKYVSHHDTVSYWDMGAYCNSSSWNPANGHDGVYISGRDNVIRNSSVTATSGAGIVVCGRDNLVTNCIVKECNYLGTGEGGIMLWSRYGRDPDDGVGLRVTHTTTRFNSWSNILVGYQTTPKNALDETRPKIQYNDFGACQWLSQENGSLAGRSAQFVEVSHNWFHGIAGVNAGDVVAEADFGAVHWTVHHNVFWQGRFAAGDCPMESGGTFWNLLRGVSWTFDWGDTGASAGTPATNGARCFNNTVVDSNMTGHRDWELDWPGYKRNNLMAKSDTAPWKFTDPVNRDYTLRAGSPAIDKGVTVPGWVAAYQGTAPDLGAYEFGEPRWVAGADWKEQPWVYPPPETNIVNGQRQDPARAGINARLRMLSGNLQVICPANRPMTIRIFDARGMLMRSIAAPGGVVSIPMSAIPAGMYFIHVSAMGMRVVWKVVMPR